MDLAASVGENTPPGAGVERNGDITVSYALVAIGIERRPRFGAARPWRALQAPEATRVQDLAEMSAAEIDARFLPAVAYAWDADQLREGHLDPRRLLVNAETPYTFATANPEGDETLAGTGDYPCCDQSLDVHPAVRTLDFAGMQPGDPPPAVQRFRDSASTLRWTVVPPPVVVDRDDVTTQRAARVMFPSPRRTSGTSGLSDAISSDASSAGSSVPAPAIQFAIIDFDEPARNVVIDVRPVANSPANLSAELWRGLERVGIRNFELGTTSKEILTPEGILSIRLFVAGTSSSILQLVNVVSVSYTTVREYEDETSRALRCAARMKQRREGRGVLSWLPNHEYRVTLSTRVTVAHARGGKQEIEIPQRVFFRTKGLPGLNAVDRVGEDLAGYIESEYPGTRPLYCTEPVAIAFNDRFNVLAFPDPAGTDERRQILEWVLAVDRLGGEEGRQPVSATASDWLASRLAASGGADATSLAVLSDAAVRKVQRQAASLDPFRMRQADMERSSSKCQPETLPAPSQVLIHQPVTPGVPAGTAPQWEAGRKYRVNVRRRAAPAITRPVFIGGDETAFSFGGTSSAAWTVTAKGLGPASVPAGACHAIFGESDWNHIRVNTTVDPADATAGIGITVTGMGTSVAAGVTALIDARDASQPILRLADAAGATLAEANLPGPPDAAAPWSLEVVAFDDQIRALVGEVTVQAARGAAREGRLSLVTTGGARFAGLSVEAIDAHRFHFTASRYRDLANHVGTFSGTTNTFPATVAMPSATFTAMLAAIPPVMDASADPEARQRLFDQWIAALALAVRPQPDALEITRLVRNGLTEALLLESDEPLPFADDLSLTMSQVVGSEIGDGIGERPLVDSNLDPNPSRASIPARQQIVIKLPIVVLTDGTQNRALVIPADAGAGGPSALPPGEYQLDWTLARSRFRSDQPHPDATLRATTRTTLQWA